MKLESYFNRFCIFYRENRLESGWIEGVKKNKLVIQPLQGKKHFLAPNRLLFQWKRSAPGESKTDAHKELKLQLDEAENLQRKIDLKTIHSLLNTGENFTLDTIADDFLEDPNDSKQKLVLLLALRSDTRWFKRSRDMTYTPRSTKELEQLNIQDKRKQEKEKHAELVQGWIQKLESNEKIEKSLSDTNLSHWLDQLEQLLVKGHESPHWKENAVLLGWGQVMTYPEERKLKQWLERSGRLMTPTRLSVLRANGRIEFDEEINDAAEQLEKTISAELKQLPKNLPTFTIDGEKTLDYDDALTIYEWNLKGIQLAVHITDVSEWLEPGSQLFKEAESRISSIYTPETTYPMFPKKLSIDTFSLMAGAERNVLSFHFQLFCRGGWKLINVSPSRIKVQENLSYRIADERIINGESFWETLSVCCEGLLKLRLEDGAINLARHEFDIDVSTPEQIKIMPLDRNSSSNLIIQELAVLVNRETGRLFKENSFPGIYRTQAPYKMVRVVEQGTDLTLEDISIEAAKLSTASEPHAGLGCKFYMQNTSPIRRFLDLVTQFQIRALLEDRESVFDEERLMLWAENIQIRQRKYIKAEREVVHYWKSCYLHQHTGIVYSGRVRRQLPNHVTEIELTELNFITQVNGFDNIGIGSEMLLLLEGVQLDPIRLELKLCKSPDDLKMHHFHGVT